MAGEDDELETIELADRGDDRPGLEDLADNGDDDADLDDFDELDDATEDDVDFVVALYREDGAAQAEELSFELANDLDDLMAELRRYPGDSGTLGVCSVAGEFFVLVRVRGSKVEVVLSDAAAAFDWPLARDVADFLGEDVDEDDDEPGPIGDLDMLSDLGLSEFQLEQLCLDYDSSSDEVVLDIAEKLKLGTVLREIVD